MQLNESLSCVTGGTPPPAPASVRAARRMADSHGRTIRDLRISITDRCNLRCVYCMEPDVRFARRESLVTTNEIIRVARVAESPGGHYGPSGYESKGRWRFSSPRKLIGRWRLHLGPTVTIHRRNDG